MKRAVACLCKAGSLSAAVELLVSRGRHSQALKLLRDDRRWDEALQLLDRPDTPDILMTQRKFLLRESASDHAVKAANTQNPNRQRSYEAFIRVVGLMSAEDEEQHLLTHGYKQELLARLEQRGSYAKAAKLLFADKKCVEAAEMLCDTNPNPGVEDFEHAIELLLAHAVQEDCSKEDCVKTLVKAQQILDRGNGCTRDKDYVTGPDKPILKENKVSTSSDGGYGLEFFLARIDPDVNSKKMRLLRLRDTCSDGDNVLIRVLVGSELDCLLLGITTMRERMLLVRDVDSI
ncbi:MAG: hypothetical protein ACPIOQ_32150, partial [Promethearchaeia archaeon]